VQYGTFVSGLTDSWPLLGIFNALSLSHTYTGIHECALDWLDRNHDHHADLSAALHRDG
jgi:hypothetical protein